MCAEVKYSKKHFSLVPFVTLFSTLYSKVYSATVSSALSGPPIGGERTGCNIGLASSSTSLAGNIAVQFPHSYERQKRISFELFHEQVPLPVPCYDLLPVTEFTVTPDWRMLQALPAPLS